MEDGESEHVTDLPSGRCLGVIEEQCVVHRGPQPVQRQGPGPPEVQGRQWGRGGARGGLLVHRPLQALRIDAAGTGSAARPGAG